MLFSAAANKLYWLNYSKISKRNMGGKGSKGVSVKGESANIKSCVKVRQVYTSRFASREKYFC